MKKDYKKYFKVLLLGAKVYFPKKEGMNILGHTEIDLSNVPYNALSLYITGFPYLALLPEAEELFKDLSETELQKLIERKKTQFPDDVPILEKALALKQQNVSNKEHTEQTDERVSKKLQKTS